MRDSPGADPGPPERPLADALVQALESKRSTEVGDLKQVEQLSQWIEERVADPGLWPECAAQVAWAAVRGDYPTDALQRVLKDLNRTAKAGKIVGRRWRYFIGQVANSFTQHGLTWVTPRRDAGTRHGGASR